MKTLIEPEQGNQQQLLVLENVVGGVLASTLGNIIAGCLHFLEPHILFHFWIFKISYCYSESKPGSARSKPDYEEKISIKSPRRDETKEDTKNQKGSDHKRQRSSKRSKSEEKSKKGSERENSKHKDNNSDNSKTEKNKSDQVRRERLRSLQKGKLSTGHMFLPMLVASMANLPVQKANGICEVCLCDDWKWIKLMAMMLQNRASRKVRCAS
jgi:hypothetical protein